MTNPANATARLSHIAQLLLFLSLQPVAPIILRAQVDRAALTGAVTDQGGNRVPQCAVRATESSTGFQRETLTTAQGNYELPNIPPGVYSVRFTKDGFAPFVAENVKQLVGQTRTLNVRLELARGQQQTTVRESLVQLNKVD